MIQEAQNVKQYLFKAKTKNRPILNLDTKTERVGNQKRKRHSTNVYSWYLTVCVAGYANICPTSEGMEKK